MGNILKKLLLILTVFALFLTGCENSDIFFNSKSDGASGSNDENKNQDAENDGITDDTLDNGGVDSEDSGENNNTPSDDNSHDNNDNENTNSGLESGLKFSVGGDELPIFFSAYKSDKSEFDIDDVTLEFFYGGYYSYRLNGEIVQKEFLDYPWFEIYFVNEDKSSIFVKRVEEDIISDKYACDFIYREDEINEFGNYMIYVEFNYSEILTIPKEIFTKESGKIYFAIYSEDLKAFEPEFRCITSQILYYKVMGDAVILSSQKIK